MPNIRSAIKAMRQSRKRQGVNQITKDKYKTALKNFRKFVSAGKIEDAKKAMTDAMATIDKAVKKHVIHKNKSSRLKSRMAKALAKLK